MFQIPFPLCIYGFAMGALICRLSQVLMNPHAPPWRRHCPARPYACTIINFINARIHARTNAAQIDCNFACMYNDRCRPRTMQRGGVYWDELQGRGISRCEEISRKYGTYVVLVGLPCGGAIASSDSGYIADNHPLSVTAESFLESQGVFSAVL